MTYNQICITSNHLFVCIYTVRQITCTNTRQESPFSVCSCCYRYYLLFSAEDLSLLTSLFDVSSNVLLRPEIPISKIVFFGFSMSRVCIFCKVWINCAWKLCNQNPDECCLLFTVCDWSPKWNVIFFVYPSYLNDSLNRYREWKSGHSPNLWNTPLIWVLFSSFKNVVFKKKSFFKTWIL